jgi:hypothetical protein
MSGSTTRSECIDLQKKYGRRYKVQSEDGNTRSPDHWLAQILCQHGHIYPQGGEMLGASTNHQGKIANTLKGLSCTEVVQDGDDGTNAIFHVDDFDTVAKVMKPKLRRVLSEEDRRRLNEVSRSTRFEHGTGAAGERLKLPRRPEGDPKGLGAQTGVIGSGFAALGGGDVAHLSQRHSV